jgi:hypothetical protein
VLDNIAFSLSLHYFPSEFRVLQYVIFYCIFRVPVFCSSVVSTASAPILLYVHLYRDGGHAT